jgi:hypothetical protein
MTNDGMTKERRKGKNDAGTGICVPIPYRQKALEQAEKACICIRAIIAQCYKKYTKRRVKWCK